MNRQKRPSQLASDNVSRRRSDLTGYAALLGESFSTRIDLLERVIRGAHYPSLGRYKERLLARLIRDYIPRRFEVGTGFVLFPHEDTSPPAGLEDYDPLNQSAFAVSKQCDILIFDSSTVPLIFRDDDFVVVRPEAVRAVIEVKGVLTLSETTSMLDSFLDFGRKWRTTKLFYENHAQTIPPEPQLFCMVWRIKGRSDGHPVTTPSRVRDTIAEYYKKHVPREDSHDLPVLSHLLIYDECDICRTVYCDSPDDPLRWREGWSSNDGRFVRFVDGVPRRDKDRTIATLLAAIHYATGQDSFNRFFSYADETRDQSLVPYAHAGFSTWLEVTASVPPVPDEV